MADQEYYADKNRFWIDLHNCATYEAVMIIETRIEECYKYGIPEIEVIYGTPDQYDGSIQQAMLELAKSNKKVDSDSAFHAGTTITLVNNPIPTPKDDKMSFAGFSASYENHYKEQSFTRNYYPCRKEFGTVEIAEKLECSVEYVRNILHSLSPESAESIVEYNSLANRNEKRWRIYQSGSDEIEKQWRLDSEKINRTLQKLGASNNEVESILKTIRKPLDPDKPANSRFKGALTRIRSKSDN